MFLDGEERLSRDLYMKIGLDSAIQNRRATVTQQRPHTAQTPATEATMPPEIIIGFRPLVLLNSMPLSAPAMIELAESCFPRRCPMYELMQL